MDLGEISLHGVNLSNANLSGAMLSYAKRKVQRTRLTHNPGAPEFRVLFRQADGTGGSITPRTDRIGGSSARSDFDN